MILQDMMTDGVDLVANSNSPVDQRHSSTLVFQLLMGKENFYTTPATLFEA